MKAERNLVEDKPLLNIEPKKRRVFFIIMYCLFIFDFISRVGINSIFPVIQADLGLSDTQVGMMGSVVLIGMAVLVLPVSFLGEKYSPKKAINLSAITWTIGTFLSAISSNFAMLLSARFLVGAGNSAYAPLSTSLMTSMYSKQEWGKRVGLYNTAMAVGMALAALIFAHLAEAVGWKMTFAIIGSISLVLSIASFSLPDPHKLMAEQHKTNKAIQKNAINIKTAVQVLGGNKALLTLCIGVGLATMVNQGILSWVSIYFVREMDMSLSFAATLISIISLVTALGYPLGGAIMDKWYKVDQRCRMFLPSICMVIAIVNFSAGFYFKWVPMIVLGCLCITTAATAYHVSTQELVPVWFKSVSYAVLVVFQKGFGAFGPMLTAILSQKFGLTPALILIQGCLAVALLIFLFNSRHYVKYTQAARTLEKEVEMVG